MSYKRKALQKYYSPIDITVYSSIGLGKVLERKDKLGKIFIVV